MPKLTWKVVAALFFLPGIAVRLFAPHYLRSALWWSFLNGESSILYWLTHHNLALPYAIMIAIACSTYDIFFWFCLWNWMKKAYHAKLAGPHRELNSFIDRSQYQWLRDARNIGKWIYDRLVPRPERVFPLGTPKFFTKRYLFYLPLPYYGAVPGGIWLGISYSLKFGLNQVSSFFLEAAGNCAKMIASGLIAFFLLARFPWLHGHLWSLLSLFVAIATGSTFFERWLRNVAEKTILVPMETKVAS